MYNVYIWNGIVLDLDELRARLLSKCTTIAMAYDSAPMSIEYMQRYRVDFGRTGGTLVLVHV